MSIPDNSDVVAISAWGSCPSVFRKQFSISADRILYGF